MKVSWLPVVRAGLRSRPLQIGVAAVAGVLLIASLGWALRPQPSLMLVQGLGGTVTFWSTAKELGQALKDRGIEVGPKDRISLPLNTPIKRNSEIHVQIDKAIPVAVVVDGKRIELETPSLTVGDLFRELSIPLGENDRVSANPNARLQIGQTITVVRHTDQEKVTEVAIPFDTVRREDLTLNQGEVKELQTGAPGIKVVKTVTHLEDGKEIGSEVVEETVVRPPLDRIVAYGTTSIVSRGGRDYRYVKELDLRATGYTAGKESNPNGTGYTYTGVKATRGVVAVDPRVIPLNSRVYVEGYGPAVAADIGGAIQGNRIDLCFDTLPEALNWGIRTVKVYILSD